MTALGRHALRFLAVGAINTLIGLMAIYGVMYFSDVSPMAANAIGYCIGLIVSFTLNKIWTFQDSAPIANSVFKYILVAVIAYTINIGAVIVSLYVFKLNPYIAQLGGVVFYTVTMFFACRVFVFKYSA